MGRPRKDVRERLAAHLGLSLPEIQAWLENWPHQSEQPCHFGRKKFWHDGQARDVPKILAELSLGRPLHASWRLQRLCPNADCVQLAHYRVQQVWRVNVIPEPPPAGPVLIVEDTLDDCIDTILGLELRAASPELIHERTGYPLEMVNDAILKIAQEGL